MADDGRGRGVRPMFDVFKARVGAFDAAAGGFVLGLIAVVVIALWAFGWRIKTERPDLWSWVQFMCYKVGKQRHRVQLSVFTLQPAKHLAVAYTAPISGPARYYVESEHPITIFAVDDANLAFWREGKPYNPIGGAAEVTVYQQELAANKFGDPFAPSGGLLYALGGGARRWHLVMVNFHPTRPTAVYYNVQS